MRAVSDGPAGIALEDEALALAVHLETPPSRSPSWSQGFAAWGAGLPCGQFPAPTSRAGPNELAKGAVE